MVKTKLVGHVGHVPQQQGACWLASGARLLTASPHSRYVTDTAFAMHSKSEVFSADIFDLEHNRFVNLRGQKLNWLGIKKNTQTISFSSCCPPLRRHYL